MDRPRELLNPTLSSPGTSWRTATACSVVQLMETGKLDEASEAYRKALALWSSLKLACPDVPEYQDGLAISYLGLGNVFGEADQLAEGAEEYRKAIALWSRLIASWPDTLDYQNHLASAYSNLGGTIGDPDEAIKVCKEAVDRFVHLTKAMPGSRVSSTG